MSTQPEGLKEFLKNPHFSRYYHTWQQNERSLVFIPLVEFFRTKGLAQEALELCEKGLVHHPQSVTGRLALARVYADLKKSEEAGTLLRAILEEFPGHPEALLLLAKLQGPSEASTVPADLGPWDTCTMAAIFARQGDYRKALGIVEKILALDPGHARAQELREEFIKCRSSSSMAPI